MNVTYSLFWFVVGAVLMRALSAYFAKMEQRDMIVKIMAQFLSISQELKDQIRIAIEMKKGHLRETGLSEDEITSRCKNEEDIIDKWSLVCTTVILRGTPDSYMRYFQKTNFKDFKN
jgi:hypothetical protein